MGKNREETEPMLGQMRRQLTRSGLRRYLYTAAAILLLFLMFRWFTRRPEYSSMYGYRGEKCYDKVVRYNNASAKMLMHDLLLQLLLFGQLVHTELPHTPPPHPLLLLERDLENLSCLFFRRNCTNHLADLSSADRLFWKIMAPGAPEPPKMNTVKLEIYLESQCPDTSRFIHVQLMKAWSLLSPTGRIELTLVPFGKARCLAKGDDFECSCQHAANECILNQLMNCVIDRLGFPDKIVPIINCIQGKRNLDDAMTSCITNNALLNEQQMRDCATGPRGRRLLALAGSRTASLQPRLDFVPWIVINGERNGDALYDLTENLCKSLEPAPEQCSAYVQNENNR